jgi:hypothetical protein
LCEIALVDYRVSRLADPENNNNPEIDDFWAHLVNVAELDLSKNLIASWSLVDEIVKSLPGLSILRLKQVSLLNLQ